MSSYPTYDAGRKPLREVRIQNRWWPAVGETPKFRGRCVTGCVDADRRLWVDAIEFAGALGDRMIAQAVHTTLKMLESTPNRADDFGIAYGTGPARSPLLSMQAAVCLDECAALSVGPGPGRRSWQYAADLERKARRYKPLRDWDEVPDALDRIWRNAIADEWRDCHFLGAPA